MSAGAVLLHCHTGRAAAAAAEGAGVDDFLDYFLKC
jgi:hypothetical protein